MTDTLTFRMRTRSGDALRRPMALLEAIEVEELIVIPGLDALLDSPQEFSLSFDASISLSGMLRKHAQRVGILKQMAAEAFAENDCGPEDLDHVPAALPVRALRFIAGQPRWEGDAGGLDVVRVAFAFVAVHALTDPTDCRTASRALHLRPRPLHDDRALLRRVLVDAMPGLDPSAAQLLPIYVSKASAYFADPDAIRWSVPFGGGTRDGATPSSSLLAYNPHALHEACRTIGLNDRALRIAPRH
ncbi:hypothetical protein [Gordonia insulae]|uniref:Uncharacterized protein n=1 Tax=Gordonia insulae TaxID=2420509 RepID=A0A3G8JUH3_9ACTN|nr:hypothetical protein [Gordonia insulae]AZG48199.1 hypothetical protein D7316_04816 [Gordonia insulae]